MKNIKNILIMASNFAKVASSSSSKEKVPPKTKDMKVFLSTLQSLKTFQARKDYTEKNLKHLSSGSSRVVFDFPGNKVLKLASNEKGVAQNKSESSVQDDCEYINKAIRVARNYSWLIAPKAEKITEREFFDLTGVNFKDFGECIKYNSSEEKDKKKPENFEKLKDEKVVKQISDIINKHKLIAGDVARISSWKVKDEFPVLVDLGLTEKIYKEYYAKSSSS